MRSKLLLFIVNINFSSAQGVWGKAITPWVYNLGSNTGTSQIGGVPYTAVTQKLRRIATNLISANKILELHYPII